MNRKYKATLNFLPIVLSEFGSFLKVLLGFVENKISERYCKAASEIKFVSLNEILPNLDEEVISYTYLDGTSYPIDIAFIKGIVRQYKNCDYLEIGSFRGESLINIAPDTNSTTSISLSKEQLKELGLDAEIVEAEGCLIPKDLNCTQIYHNSLTFDYSTLNRKFDVIFIDGDHSTDAVKIDTENAFKLLKDENSVIVWHDCGNTVNDMRYEVLEGAMRGMTETQQKYFYRVQNTLCGIYTKKLTIYNEVKKRYTPTVLFDLQIKSRNK